MRLRPRKLWPLLYRVFVLAILASVPGMAAGSPETQDLKGQVMDDKNAPIAGASCTLTAPTLPDQGVTVETDARGNFEFPGLAASTYSLTCAALGYEPVAKQAIEVTNAPPPVMEIVLPREVIVRQSVEVKETAPKVAQQGASQPSTLTSRQLTTLPLVQEKFKAALPLTPGVVRTPDGKINIKGVVENQGLLLVDAAEMVDPVSGSFSIEIPIDAVESLRVYKSAYRTEFGRFSGGLTTVETKPPSDQFHWELNDFLPTPRVKSGHVIGIADDEPRLYITGPLWHNRLNVSEAIEYDLIKQPVRGLAYPHNETKTESVNSFTSFQYIISPQDLLSLHVDIFPLRREFANINSLVPQSASSNYGQRGFSANATDRYLFSSGSILTTLFQYMKFDSNSRGQGSADMAITPDGWLGNYFNTYRRYSAQEEFAQNLQLAQRNWHGTHEFKLGGDFLHRSYDGSSISRPVELQRTDGSLVQQIDFIGPGQLTAKDTELSLYGQDQWALSDNLALTYGLRFSHQSIGEPAAFAPRTGLVYSPGKSGRTIFRAGFGVFYERVPLLAGDFTENPTRSVTNFDPLGQPLGPPVIYQNAYIKVEENGQVVVPSRNRLDSTPFNTTWSLEADREIRPDMLVRLSYLSSRTYNQFVANPEILAAGATLLLTNNGASRYHELEGTFRYRPTPKADLNLSYVHSLSRGDLNTMDDIFVPFEQPVIRPDSFAALPSNIPDRVVAWGAFSLPREVTISPVLDVHTGFPYSAFDVLQNYVGAPNSLRFPTFASLDLKLSKEFRIPALPWFRDHKFVGAFSIFNLTDHSNPRDVYNNIASPYYGHFVGFQHRFFDAYVDIVF